MKKELYLTEGTVAYVMNKRMSEIEKAGSSLASVKAAIINILQDPSIKQTDLAKKYMFEINRMTNLSHVFSTLTTYLTGQQMGKTSSRRYAS